MGGKRSGRYPAGSGKKKDKKKYDYKPNEISATFKAPKSPSIAEQMTNPKAFASADSEEETLDFETNAERILRESNAEILKQKQNEIPRASPEQQAAAEPQPEPVKPKKEDWSPVVGFVMNTLGTVFANTTGFKELNYTEEEIETCSHAGSEIINVLWPDIKALTEEQKILLVNTMILLKVHVDKVTLYNELKKQKLQKEADAVNETTRNAETKSAA